MMLAFNTSTATVKTKSFNPSEFLTDLAREGYDPVIFNFKKDLVIKLGLTSTEKVEKMLFGGRGPGLILGEVFFPDKGTCCFIKISGEMDELLKADQSSSDEDEIFADPGSESLSGKATLHIELGEVAPLGQSDGSNLQMLQAAVINNMVGDFTWSVAQKKIKSGLNGHSVQTPSEVDIELAGIICDERLKELIDTLRNKDSLVVDEYLATVSQPEEAEYFLDKMLDLGFVTEEIVVYDSDTGMPIMRAQDRSALEYLAKAGIRTPSGKPIGEEDVKRLVAVNAKSKHKISPSWVANLFLANALFKVGLTNKDILQLESSPGEYLLFCSFDGAPILFYMTDQSLDSLDDKHFKEALGNLENIRVVLYSNASIPEEFELSISTYPSVAGVSTISSLEEINAAMAELLGSIRVGSVTKAMAELNAFSAVDLAGMILQRLTDDD